MPYRYCPQCGEQLSLEETLCPNCDEHVAPPGPDELDQPEIYQVITPSQQADTMTRHPAGQSSRYFLFSFHDGGREPAQVWVEAPNKTTARKALLQFDRQHEIRILDGNGERFPGLSGKDFSIAINVAISLIDERDDPPPSGSRVLRFQTVTEEVLRQQSPRRR